MGTPWSCSCLGGGGAGTPCLGVPTVLSRGGGYLLSHLGGTPCLQIPSRRTTYAGGNYWYNRFLQPASEGCREVIFSLCVSVHSSRGVPHPADWGGGTPFPGLDRGVPHPADEGGGGNPFPGLDRGVPLLRQGGYPTWEGVPPWQGVPPPLAGVPPPHQTSTACTCYTAAVCLLRSRRRTFLLFGELREIKIN